MSTVFLTVLSGVLTFVAGQFVLKLFIEPLQDLKRTQAEIATALIQYATVYANPGKLETETEKQVSGELRRLAASLQAQIIIIPFYYLFSIISGIPSRSNIVRASHNLIGLSNCLSQAMAENIDGLALRNSKTVDKIRRDLKIEILENE